MNIYWVGATFLEELWESKYRRAVQNGNATGPDINQKLSQASIVSLLFILLRL